MFRHCREKPQKTTLFQRNIYTIFSKIRTTKQPSIYAKTATELEINDIPPGAFLVFPFFVRTQNGLINFGRIEFSENLTIFISGKCILVVSGNEF